VPTPAAAAASCADPSPAAPGSLERWPYLQDVRPTSAIVAFVGQAGGAGVVRYNAPGAAPMEVAAGRQDLRTNDSEAPEAELHPLFHSQLTGLSPDTEYCYEVAIDGQTMASGLRFRTAPADASTPVRFLVIGDFGDGGVGQLAVRDELMKHTDGVHFVLTTGDNAYDDADYDELHRYVFPVYQDLFARVPLYPVPGNHDYATADLAPYLQNFFLPENTLKAADAERYYSFDWGPVHIAGLDTERTSKEVSLVARDDQLDWLEADLKASTAPWKLMAMHRPAWSSFSKRPGSAFIREQVRPVAEANGVQLALQGHDHFYERYVAQVQGVPTPPEKGGLTWLITGGAGSKLYPVEPGTNLAVSLSVRHFLVVDADACNLKVVAIDETGATIDTWEQRRCP
jgi:acid phosphatase type 7